MKSLLKLYLLAAACCLLAASASAQCTMTTLTGTFLTPSGLTPTQAGLDAGETIATVATYGKLEFEPYDSSGRKATRVLCGGQTFVPQKVTAWVKSDGTIMNFAGTNSVTLIPTVGSTPTGLVYRLRGTLNGSSANFLAETTYDEQKALSSGAQNWGNLAVAGITALTYTGYNSIMDEAIALTGRTTVNFIGSGVSCVDNAGNTRTDCTISAGSTTVREVDLTPSVAGVTVLEFDQADGFVVTNPSGTNVRVDLAAIPDSALAQIVTASKISGAAITLLTSLPAGAGNLPIANLPDFSGVGACAANTWASTLNDNAAPTCTQPGFSNLSGAIALAQTQLTTRGDLWSVNSLGALYRLALGTNDQVLATNGLDPVWTAITDAMVPNNIAITVSGTSEEITVTGTAPPVVSIPAVLNLSGKTLKGGSPLVFEGLTADAFETTLVVSDPTAARSFTLPNADSVAVQPDAGAANNFLTAISALGVISKAQPGFSNLSGAASKAQQHAATVYTDQANTFTAGMKQTFQASATTAGFNLATSADPSTPVQGDVWFSTDNLKWRGATATQTAERMASKDVANGYAGLNASGLVDIARGGTNAATAQAAINNVSGLTTEGDLLFRDASNATRLARGTNGQCLTATATTIAWGSCAAGALGGSGTAGRVARFTAATTLGDSSFNDDGTAITSLFKINLGVTPSQALLLDIAQPGVAGARDSHFFDQRGTAFDTAGHNADWRRRVNVTSNAGASTLIIESRIDAAAFATRLSLTDAGVLNVSGYQQAGAALNFSHLAGSATAAQVPNLENLNGILTAAKGGTGANNAATLGRYLRADGTNYAISSVAAGGAGPCTNQLVRATVDNAAPTCATVTSADVDSTVRTGTVAVANGGTGSTSAAAARTALGTGTVWTNGPQITIAASTTTFTIPNGSSNFNTTESLRQVIVTRAGVLRNFYVRTTTAQPASGSLVLTIRVNGASTSITVTIAASGAAQTISDTINTASFVAGDLISIQAVNNATVASAQVQQVAMEVE